MKIKVISLLNSLIVTMFGVPKSLVLDNAKCFSSLKLTEYALEKKYQNKICGKLLSPGNGLAESTNQNLIRILKKIVINHQRNWNLALSNTL
jgi:hypothetical protein